MSTSSRIDILMFNALELWTRGKAEAEAEARARQQQHANELHERQQGRPFPMMGPLHTYAAIAALAHLNQMDQISGAHDGSSNTPDSVAVEGVRSVNACGELPPDVWQITLYAVLSPNPEVARQRADHTAKTFGYFASEASRRAFGASDLYTLPLSLPGRLWARSFRFLPGYRHAATMRFGYDASFEMPIVQCRFYDVLMEDALDSLLDPAGYVTDAGRFLRTAFSSVDDDGLRWHPLLRSLKVTPTLRMATLVGKRCAHALLSQFDIDVDWKLPALADSSTARMKQVRNIATQCADLKTPTALSQPGNELLCALAYMIRARHPAVVTIADFDFRSAAVQDDVARIQHATYVLELC